MAKYIVLSILLIESVAFAIGLYLIIHGAVKRNRKLKAEQKAAVEKAALEEAERQKTREQREAERRKRQELEEWSKGDPYEDADGSEGYIEAVDEDLDWDDPMPDEAELWEKEDERYTS